MREKGTNRAGFLRGEVDKCTWRAIGSSYVLSDILAAVLTAQLEHASTTQAQRAKLWQLYREELEPQVGRLGIKLQAVPAPVTHPAHVFGLLLPPHVSRAPLLRAMKEDGVPAVSHYEPLHAAPAHVGKETLRVTDRVASTLVRLPLHAGLSEADVLRAARCLVSHLEALA